MWIPTSASELEQALTHGGVEETATFDGKRDIGKGEDVAVDVCAMTVQGGVIVYGAGENAEKTRLVTPHPFALAGQRERISQIAQASISEPPTIELYGLERDESPGDGYLVVHVPQSARAPHQVILRGKHQGRYYGRDATGNRILTQTEVEQLYARRAKWEGDALAEAESTFRGLSSAAYSATRERVFLLLRLKSLGGSRDLLSRAGEANGGSELTALARATEIAGAVAVGTPYSPDLPLLDGAWSRDDADHFAAAYAPRGKPELLMRASHDGTLTLLSRRVGDKLAGGAVAVFESAIAGLVKRALAFAGRLYSDAGYSGAVDAALIVRPLAGTLPMTRVQREDFGCPYPTDEYRRARRFLATQLANDRDCATRELVMDLTDALVGRGFDPLH